MNCISCGHALSESTDPTQRFVICAECGAKNDLAGVEEHTQAVVTPKVRPPSRRSRLMNLVGSTLGNGMYRIDSEIGGGGMAKVYCATQLRLDRKVAVKVLPQELTEDPNFVQRFKREATVLAKFSHANIVPVFDTGEEEGIHYIVMGYIEGAGGKASTLRDLIDAKPLEVDQAVRIMQQCLSALQYAHEKSIIHRDIKPGNILIDAQGNAHLADFGIASSRGVVGDPTLTVSGSTLGTARYMAPEQGESASRADARSDIYSLGLVFYEMLVGYVPEAKTFLPGDLLTTKKQSKQFVLPSTFKPGQIDERLDQIILRAIQPDPADRFQSAAEMIAALSEVVGGNVSSPARRSIQQRRRRALRLAAAVILLAAFTAGGQYYRTIHGRIPADLLNALNHGDDKGALDLLAQHPDWVNRADAEGMTPLHHAAAENLPRVAADLLKRGAKLEAQDRKGRTPLHHAALHNRAALVVLLLGEGARQEAEDADHKTPEALAQDEAHQDVRLIFERRELIQAIGTRALARIDALVTPALSKSASVENWTALHYAAYKGDDYTAKILLDKGALVDAQTTQEYAEDKSDVRYEVGRTPLLLAAEFSKVVGGKYVAVAQLLLDHGASPGLADAKGRTPLHYAAQNDDAEMATLLLDKKADPNKPTKDGVTPLHLGAQVGSVEVVNLLLANHANPAAVAEDGLTALGLAARAGHAKVVDLLLPLKGISNDARMAARKLAAEDRKHADVVAQFDTWWAATILSTIESQAASPEQLKCISELLHWPERHLGSTTKPDGRTPLALAVAATQPSTEVITLLLDAEPAMAAKPDAAGESPLYLAVREGKTDVVKLLASRYERESLDANDPRGQRLLNVAVKRGVVVVVDLLVNDYKLRVNEPDKEGTTPLQAAAASHKLEMVNDVLRHGGKADLKALDAATTKPTDDTMRVLGAALLLDKLQDKQASRQSVSEALSRLDELKLDLIGEALSTGQLPLQAAILGTNAEVTGLLIEQAKQKKTLNNKNADGETALHTAAALGQTAAVQSLLAAGADYDAKDKKDRTPEDAANAAGHKEAALAIGAWRERQADDQARRTHEKELADERKRNDEADRRKQEKAVADAKVAADAAAVTAWCNGIHDRKKRLSLAGVGAVDFNRVITSGGIVNNLLGGDKREEIRASLAGSSAPVTCTCTNGILTIELIGEALPNLGPGDVRKKTVPHQEVARRRDSRGKVHDTVQDVTESVEAHAYTGELLQKPDGTHEWHVGERRIAASEDRNGG